MAREPGALKLRSYLNFVLKSPLQLGTKLSDEHRTYLIKSTIVFQIGGVTCGELVTDFSEVQRQEGPECHLTGA